ncbi:phage regulatory CII family protein [Enterobacteriaceae bacterium YMB-R22]|nr:phage regulatory CII family protein [Tenebrionicola larvae]
MTKHAGHVDISDQMLRNKLNAQQPYPFTPPELLAGLAI